MAKRKRREAQSIEFARNQRAKANEFSKDVWEMVRHRRCCGEKFRREYVIEPYTTDFCCVALKLIVEVDGKDHFTETGLEHDQVRDQYLSDRGYVILRIPGYDVLREPHSVRQRIVATILEVRGE